jgi:hypothetical protein
MTSAQVFHAATLLTIGKVLILGGILYPGPVPADAELYDPNTGGFTRLSRPPSPVLPTATLLRDGRVLIASADWSESPDSFSSGQLYDPQLNEVRYVGKAVDPTITCLIGIPARCCLTGRFC